MTKEIYIAGSISRPCEQMWHSDISKKLIDMGYSTYAPAENKTINDKTNNPTPLDIYNGDVEKLLSCDILLVELHGGKQDGTIWECGWACGWNERNLEIEECISKLQKILPEEFFYHLEKQKRKNKVIFFYTSNTRLLNNAMWEGIPSESLNHLVLGGFMKFGRYLGSPDEMLKFMEGYIKRDTLEVVK